MLVHYHTRLTDINILLQIPPHISINFQLVCMLCLLPCMVFIFIVYLQIHKEYGAASYVFVFCITAFICHMALCSLFVLHATFFLRVLRAHFIKALCRIPLCEQATVQFPIALLMHTHLGCFQVFSIMSSSSLSIITCFLVYMFEVL